MTQPQDLIRLMFERDHLPEAWISTSKNLRVAASLLFDEYLSSKTEEGEPLIIDHLNLDQPATLLYGYAIENAMKGLLIASQSNDEIRQKMLKSSAWKRHDLISLLNLLPTEIQTDVSRRQQAILGLLTANIIWAGKYPIALEYERQGSQVGGYILPENTDHKSLNYGVRMPAGHLNPSFRSDVERFLETLYSHWNHNKTKES